MDEFDRQAEELLPCRKWPLCFPTNFAGSVVQHGAGCDAIKRPAVAAALRELAAAKDAEIAKMGAAIEETLRLADSLNESAERGAGFAEHWGERVMQAVEPIRDTAKFKDETLAQNRILSEHNGKLIDEIADLKAEIASLHETYREILSYGNRKVTVLKAEIAALRVNQTKKIIEVLEWALQWTAAPGDAQRAPIRAEIEKEMA